MSKLRFRNDGGEYRQQRAAFYVYNEQLLSRGNVRVYLKVSAYSAAKLSLASSEQGFYFDPGADNGWIYADFNMPAGSGELTVYITADSGAPVVETYQVE